MVLTPSEAVQFMPLFKENLYVEAGVFVFWGTTFLLSLEEEGPPAPSLVSI